jgi:peroxiredoxin
MYALDTLNARRAWPVVENFMHDFTLPSTGGQPVQTSDFHDHEREGDRRSLILVFTGECRGNYSGGNASGLLLELSSRYSEIARATAEVLVVVRGTAAEAAHIKQDAHLPFPVLADEDGQVHRDYGAMTPDGRSAYEAIYVAGRYGKSYLSSRTSDGPPLPTADGVLGSLDFIESRCPECGRVEL